MNDFKKDKKQILENQLRKEERYYYPPFLNKWFAISSILFFLSMLWLFYFDNDDEWKAYQKTKRNIDIAIAKKKLERQSTKIDAKKLENLEADLLLAQDDIQLKVDLIDDLNDKLFLTEGQHIKANMDFLEQKAFLDESKYLYENAMSHSHSDDAHHDDHGVELYRLRFEEDSLKTLELKYIKDNLENEMIRVNNAINDHNQEVADILSSKNDVLKEYSLVLKQLESLDVNAMSYDNQLADFVRDLPVIDFLNPYYKIHQILVPDVKYDVNFAQVPTVDRCTSCHLGIDNPDYSIENLTDLGLYDAESNTILVDNEEIPAQPYLAHPNLDLYLTSSSPHAIEEFGCTSCHSGRGRGTDFVSTVHMPSSLEQKQEWEEKYDWEQMHYWLEPMLPTKYIQASCFKCHDSQPILEGGDQLALGLQLIDKAGCNNCHLMENYPNTRHTGPPLDNLEEKVTKDWVTKWIHDPQSFRHNTWMPHFFNQDNNSTNDAKLRSETEIYAITEYLFGDFKEKDFTDAYLGDEENGKELFNKVGCQGCHIIEENSVALGDLDIPYDLYQSNYGYEVDETGEKPEVLDRYKLLKYQGPNLIGLGSKTNSKWLFNWLKNPEEYWEHTKMPNLRLTDDEAKDITAYLMSFTAESEFLDKEGLEADNDELDKITLGWLTKSYSQLEAENKLKSFSYDDKIDYVGQKSIAYYGCYTCHEIEGFEDAKPIGAELTYVGSKDLHKFDFGHIHSIEHTNYAWMEQKLANPRIFDRDKVVPNEDKSRMPNFYFKPEEIDAIVTALLGFSSKQIADSKVTYNLVEDKAIFEGYELIYKNNCQGCHLIEDFGGYIANNIEEKYNHPPNLNTQGVKVQSDWLFGFFDNPHMIRPNMEVRMPTFNFTDKEWNSVIKALQHMENHSLAFESDYIVEKESELGQIKYEVGKYVSTQSGYKCSTCHFGVSDDGIAGSIEYIEQWAPNLAHSDERLRADWIVEWLHDPQKIMPGANMVSPLSFVAYKDAAKDPSLMKLKEYVVDKYDSDYEAIYNQLLLEGVRDFIYELPDVNNENILDTIEVYKNPVEDEFDDFFD